MKVSFMSPKLTKWIIKLALLILIAGLVSYIFFLNPDSVVVRLPRNITWQAPMAMILIATFFAGLIMASLVAIMAGFRQKMIAWQARRADKQTLYFQRLAIEGREHKAAGDYTKAKQCFRKIIQNDPENILARIFLAKTFMAEGNNSEAIATLDDARQGQNNNVELLFLAAQINERLNNYTAAFDNLSLVLKAQPNNKIAISQLVEVAVKLKRYTDAIVFQDKLIHLSSASENQALTDRRAAIELDMIVSSNLAEDELERSLQDLLRRYRDYSPALVALAHLRTSQNDYEEAIKILSRAFKRANDLKIINTIANIWQRKDNPEKAVATIKSFILLLPPDSEVAYRGSLFLSSFYISLGMVDQALKELDALQSMKQYSRKHFVFLAFLRSQALKRRAEYQQSTDQLETALISTGALLDAPFFFKSE